MLVLELPCQFLIRDPPRLIEGVPAMRGDTADLTMITLRYLLLIEPPEVRPEEHEGVGRTGRVSILALAPAALGMEIRRDNLAQVGERGQVLDYLRRERWIMGYGSGDWMFDEWLSGGVGNIEVVEATRNALIQGYDRQIEEWSA